MEENTEKEVVDSTDVALVVGEMDKVPNNNASDSADSATDLQQELGTSTNGHPSESRDGQPAESEDGKQESVAPGATFSEQSEPTTTPTYANGTGSSHSTPAENVAFASQRELIAQEYEGSQVISGLNGARSSTQNGYSQPPITSFAPTGNVARSFSALPSLAEHLIVLNTTKESADIMLQINPTNAQPFVSYAHSIILFRSLRLRRLADRQQHANANYANNLITLYPARFVMPHAFEAALRFLYSDTVLGKDFFIQAHPGGDTATIRIHNLDYLMSYWVSGIELGLDPVSICAERLLNTFLDWDILEITYKYAMEIANSPVLSHGKSMTGSDYLVASSSIIKLILQFLASHINIKTFKLDISCNSNLIPSRLPQLDDGRPRHNPALASMVFGSMPSPADVMPSSPQSEMIPEATTFKDTVASNILLNVDFENLNAFNNYLQAPTIRDPATTKLMSDIVNEREVRRHRVHSSRVSNKDRMANSSAWEPVGLRESITETNVLARDRVGFLLSSK